MVKYTFNESMHAWERIDRTQEYRGILIETITWHHDGYTNLRNHRCYRLTFPDGHTADMPINKRPGGNIKDIKEWIDFKFKYNLI